MLAESLQGVADLLTVIFLYVGVKRSSRKGNQIYNFGYGRELYFWVLCAAIAMLVITAGLSFYFGYSKFIGQEPLDNTLMAYVVLLIGISSNGYSLSVSTRKISSMSIKASIIKNFAKSHLVEIKTAFITDLMGTLSAVLGLIALIAYAITGDPRFDGLGAMIISVIVAVFALILIIESKNMIIGRSASRRETKHIKDIVMAEKEVKSVLQIMTTYFGSEDLYVNLNIKVNDNLRTPEIEKVIDRIEANIRQEKPEVDLIQVEIDSKV